jgi:hypothetical protein
MVLSNLCTMDQNVRSLKYSIRNADPKGKCVNRI